MAHSQPGVLAPVPTVARAMSFQLVPGADPAPPLRALAQQHCSDEQVVGIGAPLAWALGIEIPGLRGFPAQVGAGFAIPSTQTALWCWLRGEDRGVLIHAGQALESTLEDAFDVQQIVDTFVFDGGRDLTGYIDGTENPVGDAAIAAAIASDATPGIDGSSYVAVQQWLHDLESFTSLPLAEQDDVIGRRQEDDEELEDAPESAHVKRTAQEAFDPPAFLVRRSMPWADTEGEGLLFIAFGNSFDAFEAQLRRMCGADDDIPDALFGFSRPLTGSYFWCPPIRRGKLDLRALGIR